jgi:Spy/CpxP family protein refolding chaperone
MKKILSIALILGATALMACPMQGGMCGDKGGMGGLMQKCECDTKKLPPMMEKLDLTEKQKEQVAAIRAEGKAFHNKQHEKMMAVLTPEQKGKLEGMKMMMNEGKGKMCPKGDMKQPQMGEGGMGCKKCEEKK